MQDQILKTVTYFYWNGAPGGSTDMLTFQRSVAENEYDWIQEPYKCKKMWSKINDDWFYREKHRISDSQQYYTAFTKKCECPEVEIAFQKFLREKKLERICK